MATDLELAERDRDKARRMYSELAALVGMTVAEEPDTDAAHTVAQVCWGEDEADRLFPEVYDRQLASIASGLTEPMRRTLRQDAPWPGMPTVKALRKRGLMTPSGWAPTPRGIAVADYIDRKAKA